MTGETGAGKSILVDALGSVLGERVTSDLVRTGAMRATIDAEFQIPSDLAGLIAKSLDAAGIENGGDHLLLTREIQATGRSSARINGRPVTATLLSSIGDALVDIHGQSDHLSLLKANRQREIVDAFGVDPELLGTMRQAVGDWRSARRALDNLIEHSRETAQRVDLLRYQIDDIDSAAVRPESMANSSKSSRGSPKSTVSVLKSPRLCSRSIQKTTEVHSLPQGRRPHCARPASWLVTRQELIQHSIRSIPSSTRCSFCSRMSRWS